MPPAKEANRLFFVPWLAKEAEHVLLVDLDPRLVEGIDFVEVAGERAGAAEEHHELAHREGVHLVDGKEDVRDVAPGMGLDGAVMGFLGHEIETFPLEVIEAVEVVLVVGDDDVALGRFDA